MKPKPLARVVHRQRTDASNDMLAACQQLMCLASAPVRRQSSDGLLASASMMAEHRAASTSFQRHLSAAAGDAVASTSISSICWSPPVACSDRCGFHV